MASELLLVDNVSKFFTVAGGRWGERHTVRAVEEVSLSIARGETLGLVGESGSGKSTLARIILNLIQPTSGKVVFDGQQVSSAKGEALRNLRRRMQIVFQDPYGSLNPRMTVGRIIAEGLPLRGMTDSAKQAEEVQRLLALVGLDASYQNRYPHEFSGGQRQRIGIARALAVKPEFLAADEPVSALDVSVQAQVLNLLLDLQQQLGLTMLFVAHDLAVVRHMSDRVAVMYLGRIVELAESSTIYTSPRHPYTRTLLEAIPVPDPDRKLPDIPPVETTSRPAEGCPFQPRCPLAIDRCRKEMPQLAEWGCGHFTACHRAGETT